jgi:hypothetical protein
MDIIISNFDGYRIGSTRATHSRSWFAELLKLLQRFHATRVKNCVFWPSWLAMSHRIVNVQILNLSQYRHPVELLPSRSWIILDNRQNVSPRNSSRIFSRPNLGMERSQLAICFGRRKVWNSSCIVLLISWVVDKGRLICALHLSAAIIASTLSLTQ